MSNETPAAIDPDMFAAVFSENWDNARYIKSERISFMNAYSVICAGVLALLQSVQASDLIRIALLFFMTLFSVDHDGQIRMDPSSPYAMARLVDLKNQYDVAFANDPGLRRARHRYSFLTVD